MKPQTLVRGFLLPLLKPLSYPATHPLVAFTRHYFPTHTKQFYMKNMVFLVAAFCLFYTAKAQDNTFPTTGDGGIGTYPAAIPKATLELKRTVSGALGPVLRLTGGGSQNAQAAIELATYDAAVSVSRIIATDDGNFGCSLDFRTRTPGSSANQLVSRLYISDDGNVGIGNTSPNYKLQVNGGAFVSGGIIVDPTPGSGTAWLRGAANANCNVIIQGAQGNDVAFWLTGGPQWFKIGGSGGTEPSLGAINVNSDGNVGIGTMSINDAAYKLFVETGIRTRKIKVDQNGWPDYVFNKDYVLRPLSEIEKFIQQYQHLPDVPSAADVKKDGIDLGENQAVLVKKIEELTLYVIEQNKQSEWQKKQLADQQRLLERQQELLLTQQKRLDILEQAARSKK